MPAFMPKTKDFELLGLTADAGEIDVRSAYKSLALKWHPDRHSTDKEEAQAKFVEISEAYESLLKYVQRRTKDEGPHSHSGRPHSWTSSAPSSSGSSSRHSGDDDEDERQHSSASSSTSFFGRKPSSYWSSGSSQTTEATEPDSYSEDESPKDKPAPRRPSKLRKVSAKATDLSAPISPLKSANRKGNISEDWVFPLQVTLDDLYYGALHHYRITRALNSGKHETVRIDVEIKAGWQAGKQIRAPGLGNERKDGSFQDILFVIEEEPQTRYTRVDNDLVYTARVPWVDFHLRPRHHSETANGDPREDEIIVPSLDGEEHAVPLPRTLVEGADGYRIRRRGMPIRQGGNVVGHGDLIVKWEFTFPEAENSQHSRWKALRKMMSRKL